MPRRGGETRTTSLKALHLNLKYDVQYNWKSMLRSQVATCGRDGRAGAWLGHVSHCFRSPGDFVEKEGPASGVPAC